MAAAYSVVEVGEALTEVPSAMVTAAAVLLAAEASWEVGRMVVQVVVEMDAVATAWGAEVEAGEACWVGMAGETEAPGVEVRAVVVTVEVA